MPRIAQSYQFTREAQEISAPASLSNALEAQRTDAFAVVPMACMQELGLARDQVYADVGACALGHLIGATGAHDVYTSEYI